MRDSWVYNNTKLKWKGDKVEKLTQLRISPIIIGVFSLE